MATVSHKLTSQDLRNLLVEVEVRIPATLSFRIWLSLRLIRLAGWVSPFSFEVKET